MKYLYNSLLLFILIFSFSIAQAQTNIVPKGLINPSFGLNGGDVYANQIATTNDGYTYTAGRFTNTIDFDFTSDTFNVSSTYLYDMFISKYDKQSHLVFAFRLSGLSEFDNISAIATDKDDNIYVAGYFAKTVDFDPGSGKAEIITPNYYTYYFFFAKYDKNGNFIFVKPIVTTEDINRLGEITSIKTDDSANIFIAGYGKPQSLDFDPGNRIVHPESHGGYDAFFAKYDALGNYVFAKAVGSSDDDVCFGFNLNKNKDIIITGSFGNAINDFDPNTGKVVLPLKGISDAFIGLYDSSGNYKYAFSLGGVKDDHGYAVTTDNDSNIIISGTFYGTVDFAPDSNVSRITSDTDYDYFIAKYSQTAKLIFAAPIHTSTPGFSYLSIDDNNDIYIGGSFTKGISFSTTDSFISKGKYNAFIAKYTSRGVYQFSNKVEGSNLVSISNIALNSNNQLCAAGYFLDTSYFTLNHARKLTTQNPNSFIAVYNTSTGNNISAYSFGTYRKFNVESAVVKLAHDDQNNTYVTGTFEGITDFDPGISQYILISSQDAASRQLFTAVTDDIFFAKYNAAGKLIFAKDIGGTEGQAPISITVDAMHNIYLTGTFEGNMDADPGTDSAILYSRTDNSSLESFFIGKYDSLGRYIFAKPLYIDGNLNTLTIDKSNNIYIAGNFFYGYFNSENDTSITDVDGGYIFFAKYTNQGKFVYIKSVGEKNESQACNDIAINNKGNIIISGTIVGSNIDFDPGPDTHYANPGLGYAHFLAAYKTNGSFLFETNSVSSNRSAGSAGVSLKVDNSDNVWVTGMLSGTVNFDANSDSLIKTATGNYTVFFIKYNSKGHPFFVKTFSEFKDQVQSFLLGQSAVDNKNNFYLSGYFYGKIDFDPSDDTAYLTADRSMHSNANLFLAKYDSIGNYVYAYNFAPTDSLSSRSAYAKDLYVNKNSEITLAVTTNGKIDFDPGPDTFYYHPPFDVNSTQSASLSFALVKFKQTQTARPFTIYASTSKPDIDNIKTFNLNRFAKYLK
jgi:hypothetical protein